MSRVRVVVARCTLVALAVLAAGCSTYWGQRRLDAATPVEPTHPVWIWSHDAVQKWYGVVITQDSVSGILYEISLMCDSCRRSLPRALVDSMTVSYKRQHTTAKDVVVGVGVAAAVVAADIVIEYVAYLALRCTGFCVPANH